MSKPCDSLTTLLLKWTLLIETLLVANWSAETAATLSKACVAASVLEIFLTV